MPTATRQSDEIAASTGSPAFGCHLSSAKGFAAMGREAINIGAATFQFFTRNPRGTSVKPLDIADAAALDSLLREQGFAPVIAHAPYILNPCSPRAEIRELARSILAEDLARLEHLPGNRYTLHPGCHCGQGREKGIELIAETLNAILCDAGRTTVLLETMSGKGSEVGGSFEDLALIIQSVTHSERLGVCLDTCHIWDAGYDIVNDLGGVLAEFDSVIGLKRLLAVHINDSCNARGSRKDRHAKLGEGAIGLDAFARIVNHPALRHLPFCLETPNDLAGYAAEIILLKRMREGCTPPLQKII